MQELLESFYLVTTIIIMVKILFLIISKVLHHLWQIVGAVSNKSFSLVSFGVPAQII